MIATNTTGIRWGTERRLEFIEFRLFWEGGVNRSDLVEEFGVSVPQASKDLALYQAQAPDNIRYDRSQKRYLAADAFVPKFIKLDADAYLEQLTPNGHRIANIDAVGHYGVDKLPIPQRQIRPSVLRALLTSARAGQSIDILYQSMSSDRPKPLWRRISPHAFATDGLRWHTRAYCHLDRKFKDFILSRCLDTREPGSAGNVPSQDRIWNTEFSALLIPNPKLSASQQEVIAQDFHMEDGRAIITIRCAMLYYFSKRLRLDLADRFDDPREAPVILKNRDEFAVALEEAMR